MIEISPYRNEWPAVFAAEAARLAEVFPLSDFCRALPPDTRGANMDFRT